MPLPFSLILTAASRFLHPCSTNDKTFNLMQKRFSKVRDTQRDSQSYMEKREEGVRGDPNEIRWNQKRREQVSQ